MRCQEFAPRWAILSIAAALPAFALNPRTGLSQYTQTIWTIEEGLPQDAVRVITQTNDGYLWIGTHEGLARFDGYEFLSYTRGNGSLPSNYVTSICAARDGTLWIGTRAGLTRYANGKFETFRADQGAPNGPVESLMEEHDGTLWMTSGGSLMSFKEHKFYTYAKEALSPLEVARIVYEDSSHQLWVSGVGALMKRSGEAFVPVLGRKELAGELITVITEGHKGLWLAGNRGLILVRGSQPPKRFGAGDGLPADLVWAVLEDSAGTLWVGTNRGLARMENDRFDRQIDESLIWCLFEDRERDLWVGTNGSLNRLRDDRFLVYGRPEGLPSDQPTAVHEDQHGHLWIGFQDKGVVLFRPKGPVYSTVNGLPSNEIFAIRDGNGGDLLIATREGLSRLRNGQFITYVPPLPPGQRTIFDVLEDSQGHLWLGTMSGVFELAGSRWHRVLVGPPGAGGYFVALTETRDGSVWAGGVGGLWRIRNGMHGEVRPLQIAPPHGVGSKQVRAFMEDDTGSLFIGLWGGGLIEMRGGKSYSYSAEDGLLSDNIAHVEDDQAGYLWLSTPRGICRIAKEQLRDFRDGKIEKLTPQNFGIVDGLRTAQAAPGIVSGAGGTRSSDGNLWFPTVRGLGTIDPRDVLLHDQKEQVTPYIQLTSVIADGRLIEQGGGTPVNLHSGQVQFRYAGVYLRHPELVKYSYKLEGLDQDWVSGGSRRISVYNPLPHGNYRFRVRATLFNGGTSETQFAFMVLPAFYQTRWFLVLSVASVLLTTYGAYQLRLRQVRGRFDLVLQERARLAREIHDTLAQGFVGISSQLEGVALKFREDPGAARLHLDLALKMARHSITEARRSVMDLRTGELDGEELSAALASSAERWVAGTSVTVDLAISKVKMRLPKNLEQNLLRIAQEAVTNALKHSKANAIRVEFGLYGQALRLRVGDDGQGFEPSNAFSLSDGHFGLLGMRERAERSGGRFRLVSSPRSGTEIEVTIPLG